MSEPDDAALVRAAQAGGPSGLGELLERHRARMHAAAVGMLGHGPQAEDAVHDAFLIALRRIGDVREPAAAGAWLLTILGNVCRAQLRRPALEVTAADLPQPRALAGLDPVDEALERTALRDWVWTALERLSEPLRVVVMLRHFSSASSYEQIAEVCGVPVGTVRSRLSAAREKLAGELLATAGRAHVDAGDAHAQHAFSVAGAMRRLERDGDRRALEEVIAPAVSFVMLDQVERRGRDRFAAVLIRDYEDGLTTRPSRLIGGAGISILEAFIDGPPGNRLACPTAFTQVHFHAGGATARIVTHYARRPDAA